MASIIVPLCKYVVFPYRTNAVLPVFNRAMIHWLSWMASISMISTSWNYDHDEDICDIKEFSTYICVKETIQVQFCIYLYYMCIPFVGDIFSTVQTIIVWCACIVIVRYEYILYVNVISVFLCFRVFFFTEADRLCNEASPLPCHSEGARMVRLMAFNSPIIIIFVITIITLARTNKKVAQSINQIIMVVVDDLELIWRQDTCSRHDAGLLPGSFPGRSAWILTHVMTSCSGSDCPH